MATHSEFKDSTTGAEVVAAFTKNVKDHICAFYRADLAL